MARLNTAKKSPLNKTHEGGPAARMTHEQALRRSVLSCLLWENAAYEDGEDIAERILRLASELPADRVAALAVEVRKEFHLRHVPLLLLSALARKGSGNRLVSDTIGEVITRADELTEFVAIYAKANGVAPDKVKPKLSAQVKKGLAKAFGKFNEYQLAKYDRAGEIRLRDVLFLTHPKPKDAEQEALWKRLAQNELVTPDTWEVALSSGADKKETFERLIREDNLGYLALLRNLRGMTEAGVDVAVIRDAIIARKGAHNVLPFRYIAAARACPSLEPVLDQALSEAIANMPVMDGKTIVLVDVSDSMNAKLSEKSELSYMDAAATIASVINADRRVFTFSNDLKEVPPRFGMAGVDSIKASQPHGGTALGKAVQAINLIPHDRLIVITDEQSNDRVPDPVAKIAYMINVASHQHGVGYGRWTHIDGFSEGVLRFIHEHEKHADS